MSKVAVEPVADMAGTPSAAPSRRGMLSLIKPIGFVSFVVLVEVVAASMLAPSAQETERLAHQYVAASQGHSVAGEDDLGSSRHKDVREVELGVYNITRYNPKTNTTMAVDFELYGAVLADDLEAFQKSFEHSQARVREQVILSVHSAESADLTDAGLGLIKRRILEKTNRALGQHLVREVLITKFNFVER